MTNYINLGGGIGLLRMLAPPKKPPPEVFLTVGPATWAIKSGAKLMLFRVIAKHAKNLPGSCS